MFDVFRKDLQVIRKKEGGYVEGIWVPSSDNDSFTIKASVQIADAEILQTLPEGYRTRESYRLFTDTRLQTVKIGISNPDIVIINDENFQVIRVTKWHNIANYPTNHYEILVVKENVDEN